MHNSILWVTHHCICVQIHRTTTGNFDLEKRSPLGSFACELEPVPNEGLRRLDTKKACYSGTKMRALRSDIE